MKSLISYIKKAIQDYLLFERNMLFIQTINYEAQRNERRAIRAAANVLGVFFASGYILEQAEELSFTDRINVDFNVNKNYSVEIP